MTHRDGRADYRDKRLGGRTGGPVGSSGGDSYLLGEDLRLEVFQRQLEPPIAVIVKDLHRHQLLWARMSGKGWGSHAEGVGEWIVQQYLELG